MPLNEDTYEEKAFLSPVRDYTTRPRKWSRSQALHLTLDLFLLTVIGLLASSLWSEKFKAIQPRRILGEDMHGFIPKGNDFSTPIVLRSLETDSGQKLVPP